MMKSLVLVCLVLIYGPSGPSYASSDGQPRSQVNANALQSGSEYPMLNIAKTMQAWTYFDNAGHPGPLELDANGYPLYGSAGIIHHGGLYSVFSAPSQAERPGNYITTWVGGGRVALFPQGTGARVVSCSTRAFGTSPRAYCDNSACSAARGYISGTTLTITSPSSCNFVQGQPISGEGITVSQFGTPTIIT